MPKWALTRNTPIIMNTSSRDYVFRKFDELRTAIRWDTFNLTRDTQDRLENKLQELFNLFRMEYEKVEKTH